MRCFLVTLIAFSCLTACNKTGSGGGQTSAHLTSEQAIYKNMGQGLLGQAFMALSPQDQHSAIEAEYRALEYVASGQSISWKSASVAEQKTASGRVIAGQPYRVGMQDCRQYRHEFMIDGVPQTARGSACRNEDGTWSPLN